MRLITFLSTLLLTTLLFQSLSAEEVDTADKCDNAYDLCIEKCDKAEDGSEKCYEACQDAYDACLTEQ